MTILWIILGIIGGVVFAAAAAFLVWARSMLSWGKRK